MPESLNFDVSFYESDMEVGAIPSYPWMSTNQVGIFPHRRTLARDEPTFILMYGRRNWRTRQEEEGQILPKAGEKVQVITKKHNFRSKHSKCKRCLKR